MDLKAVIRTVPDFPEPGISFKDITPLLSDPEVFAGIGDAFAERYRGRVDAVVAIESRGFIVGAPLARDLGLPLAVARKKGKLPFDTYEVGYELEYGSAVLEMHTDALAPGARTVVIDDLLATGGTASAVIELVGKLDAEVVECAFIVDLAFLGGSGRLAPVPCYSLVSYEE